MAEAIGTLVATQIPSLSEAADIQEAFRLYHYGAPSGTNIGEYDPSNANSASLVPQSIAAYINTLNTKVAALEASPGIQPSQLTGKGALITATAASTLSTLSVGADGSVLTANTTSPNGLSWSVPSVTPDNTATFTNKTINLQVNTLTGTTAQFNAALSDNNFATIAGTETLTNKTLTSPTLNNAISTGLYLSDSAITFEGTTADDFETILSGGNPTADRTVTLPDASGTVITTGNLSSITSVGNLTSLNVVGNAVFHIDVDFLSVTSNIVSAQDGKFIISDSSTPIQMILVDTATSSMPRGTQIVFFQRGTGQVSFIAQNANVQVFGSPGLKLRDRYSSATVVKLTDPGDVIQQWAVVGDLVA